MANLEVWVKRLSVEPQLRNWLLLAVDWDILIAEALCYAVQSVLTEEFHSNFATGFMDRNEINKKVRKLFREKPLDKDYSSACRTPLSLALVFCKFSSFKCDKFIEMDASTLLQIVKHCKLFSQIPLAIVSKLQKIRNSVMHNKKKQISHKEFDSAIVAAVELLDIDLIKTYIRPTVHQKLQELQENKYDETDLKLKLCVALEQQCLHFLQVTQRENDINMKEIVIMLDDLAVIVANGLLLPRDNQEAVDYNDLRNIVQQRLKLLRNNVENRLVRQTSTTSQQSYRSTTANSIKRNEDSLNELRRELEQIKVILNSKNEKENNAHETEKMSHFSNTSLNTLEHSVGDVTAMFNHTSERQSIIERISKEGSTQEKHTVFLLTQIELKRKEVEKARSLWHTKLENLNQVRRIYSDLHQELLVATLADDIACCCWKRNSQVSKRSDVEKKEFQAKSYLEKMQSEADGMREMCDILYAEECKLSDQLHTFLAQGKLTQSSIKTVVAVQD